MDQADQSGPDRPSQVETGGVPPEFQNPESPRYQPWAEKQITNAVKEKRPLQEFLAEFDARLASYGQRASGNWDPQHNDRLLAKFSSSTAPSRRRRRRRPGGQTATPRPAGVGQTPRSPASLPPALQGDPNSGSDRRRRRRRRPRGGRRGPEAGSGV